jgi:hypothetical protein
MIAFATVSAALVLVIAASLRRPESRTLSHPAILGAVALFVAALIVRGLSVEPTLVHADVVAPVVRPVRLSVSRDAHAAVRHVVSAASQNRLHKRSILLRILAC